jgi:hypothetical protein
MAHGVKSVMVVRDINALYEEFQLSGEISSKKTTATNAKPLCFKVAFDHKSPSKAELKTIHQIMDLK